MLIQLTPLQARVIGALLEKEITTPDQYPLSLNALTLACNQKSNRDPVMQLSESEVQNILDELRDKNMLFEHTGSGSRVVKYKHRFCNTEFNSLKFSPQEVAIICVLLLRGPQTPGELRTRTNRLAEFSDVNEVEACLQDLANHDGDEIVVKLPREPGKREARYAHLFSGKSAVQEHTSETNSLQNSNYLGNKKPETQSNVASENQQNESLSIALQRIDELESKIEKLSKQLADMQETIDILSS